MLGHPDDAHAQITAPAVNRDVSFMNAFGLGASIGTPYQRDAYFWGLTLDYMRVIRRPWSVTTSLNFDQEHEEGSSPAVNTFTLVATINWSASRLFTFTTGLGKGFIDDNNSERSVSACQTFPSQCATPLP